MSKPDFSGRFSSRTSLLIILLLSLPLLYGAALTNGFVWDDGIFLINNPVYRESDLAKIFFSLANGVEYLPLRDLTYVLDSLAWGKNPFGFHLTNLLFFAVNVFLVHTLADIIFKRVATVSGRVSSPLLPVVVAAGFAFHPFNAEAANFITCRNVLVSGACFFFACIAMLRALESPRPVLSKWYAAAILGFIGAMLGKATAIMFPLLLLLILPFMFPGELKRISVMLAPFFVIAAGFYLAFRRIAVTAGITDLNKFEFTLEGVGRKIAVALQIPSFYLGKLFLPHGFSVDYGVSFGSKLVSLHVAASLAILLVLAAVAAYFRRRLPVATIGIFWFAAALVPVLNFFGTTPIVADRYVFLPIFGFMLAMVSLLDRFSPAKTKIFLAVVLLLPLAGISAARALDWKSDETLWKSNIRNYPDNSKSYLNLAAYYFNGGEQQKALDLLETNSGIPWLPVYMDYYRGRFYYGQKNFPAAKQSFNRTLDVVNGFIGALRFMGQMGEEEGDYAAAVRYYNRAVSSDEQDSSFELPKIRERLKEIRSSWLDRQLSEAKARLEANPGDNDARRELALFLDQLGFYQEALEHYLALEKQGVHAWQIYQNIANCYFNLRYNSEAIKYYEKVISSGQGIDDTFNNIGIAYRRLENYDKSIMTLKQGVSRFPASPYVAFNLAVTYHFAGKKDQAREVFTSVVDKSPEFRDRAAQYLKELSN